MLPLRGLSHGAGAQQGGLWGVAAWGPGPVPQLEGLALSTLGTGQGSATLAYAHVMPRGLKLVLMLLYVIMTPDVQDICSMRA